MGGGGLEKAAPVGSASGMAKSMLTAVASEPVEAPADVAARMK